MQTGCIVGAEALIRWTHPDVGIIPPDKFVPILEETGLIHEVGLWIIRSACTEALRWDSSMHIAINLSAAQLYNPRFLENVKHILDNVKLPVERIEFEITESIIMEKNDVLNGNLEGIRELGINIALDDFGTGFSSLSYLQNTSCDVLKLDKSLIDNVGNNTSQSSVIEAVVFMAHSMGMQVVAEGVEGEEQVLALAHYQVDILQGFHFSAPLPVDAFQRFMDEYTPGSWVQEVQSITQATHQNQPDRGSSEQRHRSTMRHSADH